MDRALIHNGFVHAEASDADAALMGADGRPLFDIRDVSKVVGIMPGWHANGDGTFSAPDVPSFVPDRCTKLGLKRVLAETGPNAVFKKPEWPAVKAVLAANEDLQEDWDLAVEIVRHDPLVQALIAERNYDDATVDKILVRAVALVS